MNHRLKQQSDETVLMVEGVLDANTAPELRATLDRIIEEPGGGIITVDLSSLRLIDSSGVGALVSLYKRARANGRNVRVVGLSEQPLAIFRLLKLDTVFALS